jgi:DNA-binding HxlR family transcriptional regulator
MKKTSFDDMPCPIARALDRVGEWWSILILRDAFYGITRFDEFEKSLGIAPNMLTRRLNGLVEAGLLERRPYQTKPVRYEYVLTDMGRDFRPVMLAMMSWGNKYFATEGLAMFLVDERDGHMVDVVLTDRHTGDPITRENHAMYPGPAASPRMRTRLETHIARRAAERAAAAVEKRV